MKSLKIIFLSLSLSAFLIAPVIAATSTDIIYTPQVPIPNANPTDGSPDFSKGINFSQFNSLQPLGEYIKYIMKYVIGICAILGTIMVMIGGFKYVLSGGDSGMIKDAQDTIFSAFIGIILAASSYLILATVNMDLVHFKATKIAITQTLGCCELPSSCESSLTEANCTAGKGKFFPGNTAAKFCYENKCTNQSLIDAKLGTDISKLGKPGEPCGVADKDGNWPARCIKSEGIAGTARGFSCNTIPGFGDYETVNAGKSCDSYGVDGSVYLCCVKEIPTPLITPGTLGQCGAGGLGECRPYSTTGQCPDGFGALSGGGNCFSGEKCCAREQIFDRAIGQTCGPNRAGTCELVDTNWYSFDTCPGGANRLFGSGLGGDNGGTCSQGGVPAGKVSLCCSN